MSFLSSIRKKGQEFFNSSKGTVTQTNEKPLPPLPQPIPNVENLTKDQIDTYNDAKLAITMIERFIAQLSAEMAERSKQFGKKFIRLFPNTKIDKIDELDKLVKNIQQTIDIGAKKADLKQSDWHLLVAAAKSNEKIKRTFIIKARALNVLQNILDGHPKRGIKNPVGKGGQDIVEWTRDINNKRWF